MNPLQEKIDQVIAAMLLVRPTAHVAVDGNGGLHGTTEHQLTFADYVTRGQVEAYLASVAFFGVHPRGAGGVLHPIAQHAGRHWSYVHGRTTGD